VLQRIDRVLFKGRLESSLVLGVAALGFYLVWALAEAG
jgi:hypothetical protein